MGSPRAGFGDMVAAVALIGVVLCSYWEVTFLGRTLTTSVGVAGVSGEVPPPGYGAVDVEDTYRRDRGASAWGYQPWARVTNHILQGGSLPLWTPYQAGGAPLAANMQSAVFDPLMLPVHLDPQPRTWDVSFLVVFAAGTLATYALARVLGLGGAAAFVAALVNFLSGFYFMNSNNQFVRVYMYLPVLFLAVEAVARRDGRVPVLVLAAAIAGSVLAGMPEPTFFVLAAAGAYGLYRVVAGPRSAGRLRVLARLCGAAALGIAFAAPLLVPFLEYLGASFHLHTSAVGLTADEPRWALNWVLPLLDGPPGRPRGGVVTVRDWVGMAAVALGAVALTAPGTLRRTGGPFFAGCAAVLLLKQFGVPPFQWLGLLPIAEQAIFPVFGVPVVAFCLALLAGIGVQAITAGEVRPGRCSAALLALLGLVALGLAANRAILLSAPPGALVTLLGAAAVAVFLVSLAATPAAGATKLGVAACTVAGVLLAAVLAPAAPSPYVVVPLAAGALLLVLAAAWGAGRRNAGALVALVAVGCELALFVPHGIYPRRTDPYAAPAWLEAVLGPDGSAGTGRIAGFGGALYPNTAGVFGLQDVRVLEALYVDRYVRYLRTFIEPEFDDRFTGHRADEATRPNVDANPMWDLLGVRYLLAAGGEAMSPFLNRLFAAVPPGPGLRPDVFGPAGDARPALVMTGPQEAVYPLYEDGARSVAFSWAAGPAPAGAALSVDAVTPLGRVPVWRTEPASSPAEGRWRDEVVALGAAGASPVQAVVLRADATAPGGVVAWAGLAVTGGDAPPPHRLRPVSGDGSVQVVEDPGRLPRALVVHRARAVAGADEAIAYMSRDAGRFADGAVRVRAFDPRNEAVVESGPGALGPLGSPGAGTGAAASSAEIVSYEPDRVEVVARTGRPGLLVLTDVFYPGWKATVNGRDAPVHPVDLAFRGVVVGEGASTVVFSYEPLSFRAGLAAAAAAVLASLVWVLRGRRGPRASGISRGPGGAGGLPARASRSGSARGRPAT